MIEAVNVSPPNGPCLCAVRKRQAEEYLRADPGLNEKTVPTDDTCGGVEMYRDYQGRPCCAKVRRGGVATQTNGRVACLGVE